jgi:hypothetical protein
MLHVDFELVALNLTYGQYMTGVIISRAKLRTLLALCQPIPSESRGVAKNPSFVVGVASGLGFPLLDDGNSGTIGIS